MNKISFARPDVGRKELESIQSVLQSGWLTTGPRVSEFERRIEEITGAEAVIAVDSCTTALEFSLRALGIGPGDEVITTPFTYTATADVIYAVGAKIVFADLDGESFEMDYDDVEKKVTSKTKAIIAVDYGGRVCDYDRIFGIVDRKKGMFIANNERQDAFGRIVVIADSAHSFTASRFGHKAGSYADITCLSFHVLKNITTGGEGGAICLKKSDRTSQNDLSQVFAGLRHHFQTGKSQWNGWEYDILDMGYNRPMTDINAAIGLAQLDRFDEIKKKRIEITRAYDDAFRGNQRIVPLIDHFEEGFESAFHLYPVDVFDEHGRGSNSYRDKVIARMMDAGIPCNVHYKPLPLMTAYKKLGFCIADYPNALNRYLSIITIPYHTLLDQFQLDCIAQTMKKVVEHDA